MMGQRRGKDRASRRRWGAVFLGLAVGWPAAASPAECRHPQGNVLLSPFADLNQSGTVNVADAVCGVSLVLAVAAQQPAPPCLAGAFAEIGGDLNCDGQTTVADVLLVIASALGTPLDPTVDGTGDGCPDACAPCVPPEGTSCFIAAACVPDGALDPSQDCRVCDPVASTTGWVVAEDDTPCEAEGLVCAAGECVVAFEPIAATGGQVVDLEIDSAWWRLHAFTGVGTSQFVVTDLGTTGGQVQYLVVAGGGGGGSRHGGGGGAGGVLHNLGQGWHLVTAQSYPVVVGAGGAGAPAADSSAGSQGSSSSALGFTAIGGGFGTSNFNASGAGSGGSGGGGRGNTTHTPGSGIPGQGNAGGAGTLQDTGNPAGLGGGGGGAAAPGVPGNVAQGASRGRGGAGVNLSGFVGTGFGAAGWFAGGGGGGGNFGSESVSGALGGQGGGGQGNVTQGNTATAGLAATGGGGGGGGHQGASLNYAGRPGGSGVVIIRYPLEPL